jgi:glycosyltransferase involved in cell wall biosynthesis
VVFLRRSPRRADGAPPRLLAVSHTGLASGAETVLLRVAVAAAAEGWEVTFLSPAGPMAERIESAGLRQARIPELKLPGGPRPLAALRVAWRGFRAGRRLKRAAANADVVLVNGILALPALVFARTNVPTGWIVHDVIHKPSWLLWFWACRRTVDRAIAVSDAAARPLRAAGVATTLVRNGVEWPVEPAPLDHEGPPVIGCAALLTPWKGQSVLLEAVARLSRRDAVVELVGGSFPKDGPYVEALRTRAAQPDLAGRVRFVGYVPDVLDRLRTWTVAVSPSVDPEAGPLALLEYMSVGVASVATAHGGPPEVIDHAGILVPPNDVGALADALERLLDDPELRRNLAANGPRTIEARKLTAEESQRQMLACLKELAQGRDAARTEPRPETATR